MTEPSAQSVPGRRKKAQSRDARPDPAPVRTEEGEDSRLNEITKRYKADPTIENYVKLRKLHPEVAIEVAVLDGIEFVFAFQKEVEALGLDPRLICGILDANEADQSALSIKLLEKLVERRSFVRSGAVHSVSRREAIGDAFVNYLIGACLDALSWNDDLRISRDLIVLIRHQLGLDENNISQEVEKRNSVRKAKLIGAQLISAGINPSFRLVGKRMGVSASTVKRWFPNGDFRQKAERLSDLFEDGTMVPLARIGKRRDST